MGVLPFCDLTLTKLWRDGNPKELNHIGDHVKTRRLELDLKQTEAADRMEVTEATVVHWEKGKTPALWHYPKILAFLGYDPLPTPTTVGLSLRRERVKRGLSLSAAARLVKLDPATLARVEVEWRPPHRAVQARVDRLISLLGINDQDRGPLRPSCAAWQRAASDPIPAK